MPIRTARRVRKLRKPMSRAFYARVGRRIRRKVLGGRTHAFTEKCQLASIAVPGAATVTGTLTYKLSDLVNVSSFTSLFDLYKLKAVKLTLVPLANQSDFNTPGSTAGQLGNLPMLYLAPNRDPYVPAPTGIADVLNDDGCKVRRFSQPTSFYLRSPKPDLRDSQGHQIPIQMNIGKDFWLATGGNGQAIDQSIVPHFGHRYVLTNNSPLEMVVQVYVNYYFVMKEQD